MEDRIIIDEEPGEETLALEGNTDEAIIPNPYPLKFPISVTWKRAGAERVEEITEIKLRRATANDLLLIDRYRDRPMQLVLEMVAALSGHPVKVIGKLDGDDIGPLAELAFTNAPDGQRIGAISSAT